MKDSLFAIQVSKPREKFINESPSHNESLWKGVWGRTFLQSLSRSRRMRDYGCGQCNKVLWPPEAKKKKEKRKKKKEKKPQPRPVKPTKKQVQIIHDFAYPFMVGLVVVT